MCSCPCVKAGYYLEFERFNPHPENALMMPLLDRLPTFNTAADAGLGPLGFKAAVIWVYHRPETLLAAQNFYGSTAGFDLTLVCEQPAVAEIWQAAPSAFIGVVDSTTGMHQWSPDAGVSIILETTDLRGWQEIISTIDGCSNNLVAAESIRGNRWAATASRQIGSGAIALNCSDPGGYTVQLVEKSDGRQEVVNFAAETRNTPSSAFAQETAAPQREPVKSIFAQLGSNADGDQTVNPVLLGLCSLGLGVIFGCCGAKRCQNTKAKNGKYHPIEMDSAKE